MRIHARDQACEERVGHERWNQVHAAARAGDKGIAKYMRRRARGGGTSIAKCITVRSPPLPDSSDSHHQDCE
jgi:hypothetical protein